MKIVMRRVTVSILAALHSQALSKQFAANHSAGVQDSFEKLSNKVVDSLFDRTLKAWHLPFADLEHTTCGKPTRFTMPSGIEHKSVIPHFPRSGLRVVRDFGAGIVSASVIDSQKFSIPFIRWPENNPNDKVRSHRINGAEREVRAQSSPSMDFATSPERAREPQDHRSIAQLQKFARLPVWPLWNGVFIFVASKIIGDEAAAKLEAMIGGRVCPNFFNDQATNPFLLLVHHTHTFSSFDPLRYIQRFVFPEGFPAHPHRGFITITYCLAGGMVHRDSMGNKQVYGAEESHGGQHTQWLVAGKGMLHEEMWDVSSGCKQELFQLWLNLPRQFKMISPDIQLFGDGDKSMPIVKDDKSRTVVLAGQYGDQRSAMKLYSDITILHVTVKGGGTWTHALPQSHRTGIIYMRKGSGTVNGQRIGTHYTAFLTSTGRELVVDASETDGADFLLLAGEPIPEPIVSQGSMVMSTPVEINQAYQDYSQGYMGTPWSESLSDEEWKNHVKAFPNYYAQALPQGREFQNLN